MTEKSETLREDDVLTVTNEKIKNILDLSDATNTYRVKEWLQIMIDQLVSNKYEELVFKEGIDCEVMRTEIRGWRKGKIKINIEFYPEEPESPLDEIRQGMNKDE